MDLIFPDCSVLIQWIAIAALWLLNFQDLSAQNSWIKNETNPVIKRDTIIANFPNDLIAISDPWVIRQDELYKMWYTAGGFNFPIDTLLRSRIGYATSTDGEHWDKYTYNPVFDVSYNGGWDSLGVETASVMVDSTAAAYERYKMWYAGQYYNAYRYEIGYAYSADGIQWTRYPDPVLHVGSADAWDNGFLEGPSVIIENGIYKMWYCGYDAVADGGETDGNANIGYATSQDGIHWTKYSENPVFTTNSSGWESYSVQDPHVIKLGDTHRMWYGGNDEDGYGQQVGYATSGDGIYWTRSGENPVLPKGNPDDWDSNTASFPAVILGEGYDEMWYTGKDIAEPPPNDLNYYWEIGYARSPTGSAQITYSEAEHSMTLSPNPVKGVLRIRMPHPYQNVTLQVVNQMGQIVIKARDFQGPETDLNVSDLSPGIYFVILFRAQMHYATPFAKYD